ncbi:AAA family ATPase [Serratia sp. JUb9]|nr:AAA family ATPase [Serratia sp. JUb9]
MTTHLAYWLRRLSPDSMRTAAGTLLSLDDMPLKCAPSWPDSQSDGNQSCGFSSQESPFARITDMTECECSALLDQFTLDITAKAQTRQLDPVLGRDAELRQIVDVLSRRRKNNPILVGEPGVGKSALVEGLAQRIVEGNVPDGLKNMRIRRLDVALLQAGPGDLSAFTLRLLQLVDAIRRSPQPILLLIDEVHTPVGVGESAGSEEVLKILKPALMQGELRLIITANRQEYQQHVEWDTALGHCLQKVSVDEPDDETACLMLRALKERYAQHHGVYIQDSALKAAVVLSRRYLCGRQLPDKAVDLLDIASARVRMSLEVEPAPLTQIRAELAALAMEQQAIEQDEAQSDEVDPARLADICDRCQWLLQQQASLEQQLRQEQLLARQLLTARQAERSDECMVLQQQLAALQASVPLLSLDVDARMVATVIADWCGIELSSLLKDERSCLLQLEQRLTEQVIGQESAMSALAQRLYTALTQLRLDNGPLGVFLLLGPAGVGKMASARALAENLFADDASLLTLNMAEYQEACAVKHLIGGHGEQAEEEGTLTEAVRLRPYSVVLLEEVEKAHGEVLKLLCQLFERGSLRDGQGRLIDFHHTVFLMSSELGREQLHQQLATQPDATDAELSTALQPILRARFQPALLAQAQVLIYRPLDVEALRRIVASRLQQIMQRLRQRYDLRCVVDDSLSDALVSAGLQAEGGVRHIDSVLNQQILPTVSRQLLQRLEEHRKPQQLQLAYDARQGVVLNFDVGTGYQC